MSFDSNSLVFHGLVEGVVEGAEDDADAAWHQLWQACEPTVWAVTGKFSIAGPLSERAEERRNIVILVMERLRSDGFRRLRLYLESARRRPASSFRAWLATVTARTAIDYVRAHPEYADLRGRKGGGRWVRLVAMRDVHEPRSTLDPEKGAIAAAVLERAQAILRSDQLAALLLWLQGERREEIADQLCLPDPVDADRLVRSALKRLRDQFREAPSRAPKEEVA